MSFAQRIRNSLNAFREPAKNSMGTSLGSQFLKYGNSKPLVQDWSQVVMRDQDLYTGYSYGAIRNRANAIAQLATNNLKTDASKAVMEAARAKDESLLHPYLPIIEASDSFDDYTFWKDISVFLDLEGVYYLMAVRTVSGNRVGHVQEFQMLNPFEVRRIINKDTLEVGGYVELRQGKSREIPPQMIIEMRELNPFSHEDPYSMGDAMRDSQFTMKSAGDYTRHSIRNNINAPGAISTDVQLDPEQFANFKARIVNHEKGEPIFGNGSGAINWQDMQIDLNSAALDKVSDMGLNQIIGVTGNSRTMFGIEQSGVTRDTAKVQQELFIANQGIPQLQLMIAALNQDYKKYYKSEFEGNKFRLYIDSPLGVDREAEKLDVEIRQSSLELYESLVAKGYDREVAAKYACGEVTLEELGDPVNDPIVETPVVVDVPPTTSADTSTDNSHNHDHDIPAAIHNAFDDDTRRNLETQQASLQNRIVNIQESLVLGVINKVSKNAFDEQSDIVSQEDRKEAERDLEAALALFYGIIVPLYANTVMRRRIAEFQMQGSFSLDEEAKNFISENAQKAAESHVNTILEDLLNTVRFTSLTDGGLGTLPQVIASEYPEETVETVRLALKEAAGNGSRTTDEIVSKLKEKYAKNGEAELFKGVRSAALDGASQQQLVSGIKKEYTHIAQNRAKTIAHTETNRAFTHSQLDADRQFLEQNNLTSRAYKKLITRSDNPCAFCLEAASRPPIPFSDNFFNLGDDLTTIYEKQDGTTSVRKLPFDYEPIAAGNLHVGCFCSYILIIQ